MPHELKTIIHHIEAGDRDATRAVLNTLTVPPDESNDLKIFIGQLDDYLNNEAAVITGAITLDDIKRAYIELFGPDRNS
jgi:hypothetical protein